MSRDYSLISIRNVIIISIIVRVTLIFYSEWHDAHSTVKYTDIDYRVFTDAARFLYQPTESTTAKGPLGTYLKLGDPYERDTYRYTPLLALLLTPNIWLHPTFGKFLFAGCDILVGFLLYKLLLSTVLREGKPQSANESTADDAPLKRKASIYSSLYLLNPMVFSISTRGSSESTISALVVLTLFYALTSPPTNASLDATAVMLGFATHWKVYPFIYGASLVAVLGAETRPKATLSRGLWSRVERLVNWRSFRLALVSGGTFMALNVLMYLVWGCPFLYETYIYHLHRLDHKHNFSPYWLPIYLTYPASDGTPQYDAAFWQRFARSPLASFVPQMVLTLGSGTLIGITGRDNLPFAWFMQTALFVTFNKVCTSQYFLWYLTLLPLILPRLSMSLGKAISIITLWVGAQALWLKFAYDLEFLGKNTYFEVWTCSLFFLFVNCWALGEIAKAYQWDGVPSNNGLKED